MECYLARPDPVLRSPGFHERRGFDAQQLQGLKNFAVSRSEVYLDMAAVSRVDFVSAGDFVGVLVGLNCGGKKLRVRHANEMIRALFGVMGVDQFADALRRKIG